MTVRTVLPDGCLKWNKCLRTLLGIWGSTTKIISQIVGISDICVLNGDWVSKIDKTGIFVAWDKIGFLAKYEKSGVLSFYKYLRVKHSVYEITYFPYYINSEHLELLEQLCKRVTQFIGFIQVIVFV